MPQPKDSYDDTITLRFVEKKKKGIETQSIKSEVDLYRKDNIDYFVLRSTSLKEFEDGCNWLKKGGYFSGSKKDTSFFAPVLFQKNNITIQAIRHNDRDGPGFTFLLQKKELPKAGDVQYGDDLLQFNSHEFLVAFFGSKSVKRDVYYFSEHELKQCSVLFPNTDRQAIFVWNDEDNLAELSYILISGISPALRTSAYNGSISQNKWTLKNGIYSSMSIKEVRDLNGDDFQFYGRLSDFLFMVPPENQGNIDFKKIGLTLGCLNCNGAQVLEKQKVSASEAMTHSLALYVVYIMIMPG